MKYASLFNICEPVGDERPGETNQTRIGVRVSD